MTRNQNMAEIESYGGNYGKKYNSKYIDFCCMHSGNVLTSIEIEITENGIKTNFR